MPSTPVVEEDRKRGRRSLEKI